MIQIKIRDTLVDIVEKIESQKSGDIILDFPLGHPILHNYVSLKVIKSKAKNKRLIIATSDKVGRKIGKSLGIEYSLVKNSSFLEKDSQTDIMKHNFSFWEYFKFQIRSYSQEFSSSIEANKKFNTLSKYSRKYKENYSLHIFFIIFFCSFLLFLFIYYFAISQTIISITPERIIKKEAHNFVFKENIEDNILGSNKYIKIDVLSQKVQSSETYGSTDIKSDDNARAKGKVKLFNMYSENQKIIGGTRLQTKQGVIYETKDWVEIPASTKDNFGVISPGEIEIEVIAREKDATGKYIGELGNIGEDIEMFLPALDTAAQKMLYAKSSSNFQGGNDIFQKVIAENDIENAKELFQEKLRNVALKSIKNTILKNNLENSSNYDILSGGKSILYGSPEISTEGNAAAGDILDVFSLSGSITITAYIYNKDSIIQKLKTRTGERMLEGVEKLAYIDANSLRMSQIIYIKEKKENEIDTTQDDEEFELKATFELESVFIHDFLNTENSYIDLLKAKIRGLPKQEALKILLNDSKISNVHINIRPFFVKSVSNISNNIEFKIR